MRLKLSRRSLWAVATCIAVVSAAACAVSPGIDGGIVGTGNRIDCEALAKKEGTQAPVPEDCKRESAATR